MSVSHEKLWNEDNSKKMMVHSISVFLSKNESDGNSKS